MHYVPEFLLNTWSIWLDTAPWLALGLVMAGVLKLCFPAHLLQRWLGGRGLFPILKAAAVGTPLPLCSCSVLPTAIQLRRSGASKSSTVSFLIATPENGADSIALTYVLLGPVMTIIRPVAAMLSAVSTGLLTSFVAGAEPDQSGHAASPNDAICDGADCCCSPEDAVDKESINMRPWLVEMGHATADLLDDIAGWLLVGILLAAALNTFVPPGIMAHWGSGLGAMLAILAISVPMYICATASTPVAASMLAAGVSPGTVLVFLLAGPATNLGSVGLIRRELGGRVTVAYLVGVAATSVGLGVAVDAIFANMHVNVTSSIDDGAAMVPSAISMVFAVLLGLLAIRPLRRVWQRAWSAMKP